MYYSLICNRVKTNLRACRPSAPLLTATDDTGCMRLLIKRVRVSSRQSTATSQISMVDSVFGRINGDNVRLFVRGQVVQFPLPQSWRRGQLTTVGCDFNGRIWRQMWRSGLRADYQTFVHSKLIYGHGRWHAQVAVRSRHTPSNRQRDGRRCNGSAGRADKGAHEFPLSCFGIQYSRAFTRR